MYLTEIPLEPIKFQEVEVPKGSRIVTAFIVQNSQLKLLLEVDEEPDQSPFSIDCFLDNRLTKVAIYLLKTGEPVPEEVIFNCAYLKTVVIRDEFEDLVFHIYIDHEALFSCDDEFDEEDFS
jgi:hypothetical protein